MPDRSNASIHLAATLLALLLAGVSTGAPAVSAQPLPTPSQPSEPEQSDASSEDADEATEDAVPSELASPRATMRTFLESFVDRDWDAAISTLDFAGQSLPDDVRRIRGRQLAAELKDVLDRVDLVELEEVPRRIDGDRWVWREVESIPIALSRTEAGWRFSSETLDSLPDLMDAVEDRDVIEGVVEAERTLSMWIRDQVPRSLRSEGFLLEHWQWLGLALLIFLGVLADRLLMLILRPVVGRRLRRARAEAGSMLSRITSADAELVARFNRPLGVAAMAAVWLAGLHALGLPATILAVLLFASEFVLIAAIVWAAYRLVDLLSEIFAAHAERTQSKIDDVLVPLLRKTAKIFVTAFGIVFLADNLDLDITGLLAGLGIGGIAFALAAKDTVENLFGSFTVLLDRPFQVGDWIVTEGVEGMVEQVGFRSTRIRTFYSSLVTLPNANLINAAVDNYGARQYRRWRSVLGITYDTPPERVDAFCEGIRELVRHHPYTRKDSYQVYLSDFGASSLQVLLYVFFETPDWATELRERHRLGVDILLLARRLEIEFAFPTQTLYLRRDQVDTPEAADDYAQAMRELQEEARSQARGLVEASLGGKVPPPVGMEGRGEEDFESQSER